MKQMLRGQDVDLRQAKILIDIFISRIGIDQRESNRVFFLFVYPGVKAGYVRIFNDVRVLDFTM